MTAELRSITIILGGQERHLHYDVNALIDLSEELGHNLLTREGCEEVFGKTVTENGEDKFVPAEPSYKRIRAIVWAGLRYEDESVTVRQVGAWLNPGNLKEAVQAYEKALSFSQSDGANGDPKEQPAA